MGVMKIVSREMKELIGALGLVVWLWSLGKTLDDEIAELKRADQLLRPLVKYEQKCPRCHGRGFIYAIDLSRYLDCGMCGGNTVQPPSRTSKETV